MFCGERSEEFDEAGLDLHYLRECPMLKKCEHCKQMTEISAYKHHLLAECEGKAKYKLCPRCKEPLTPKLYDNHQINRDCPVALPESVAARCLLCHEDVKPNNDGGWRRHLIGLKACQGNSRRGLGIGKPQYGGTPSASPRTPPTLSVNSGRMTSLSFHSSCLCNSFHSSSSFVTRERKHS